MTFPCLVCGELPVVEQPVPQPVSSLKGTSASSPVVVGAPNGKKNGATIRTLSKDVSDKIFQNLCRHLYVKTEPYWFIQNPGEQMPLCAFCSGVVLEVYTLQTKMDQYQQMIKRLIWKLERIVADTEIASNWMATREEQESEEEMWNNIPCPPMAIRIARERHHKFRQQILLNFKGKVKIRQKMRASGQPDDDEIDYQNGGAETNLDAGEPSCSVYSTSSKRARTGDLLQPQMPGLIRASQNSSVRASPGSVGPISSTPNAKTVSQSMKIPSTISVSAVNRGDPSQDEEEFGEDEDVEEEQVPVYPDVQIVCAAGPQDYFKEEPDYSNSGDGDDSTMEQEGYWNTGDDNMDDMEAMSVSDGEDVILLAPGLAIKKSFVNQLLSENLKPSVFLRKLVFAVFGLKQVANSSGICGSNKPGAKPSLDRYKFEALREYTVETYGIRDNIIELEDLNRKIRTICCDARKAIKRKNLRAPAPSQGFLRVESVTSNAVSVSPSPSTSSSHHQPPADLITGHLPDLYQLSGGSHNGSGGPTRIEVADQSEHQLNQLHSATEDADLEDAL